MSSTSLAIDSGGDLEIIEGKLRLVVGTEYTEQKLKIRLSFVKGEWFLDTRLGIPYFEEIFDKLTPQSRRDDIIKEAILGTEGIDTISRFQTAINSSTRELLISFDATTTEGEDLTFTETFVIGVP